MVGLKKKYNNMWKVYLLMVAVVAIISYFWVRGIDYMKENHPDYNGEDFLNWDEDDKNTIL
jgi:hypothetical protein